ncbi:hypothetical protein IFM89_008453, partial [Coptis chinensis]
CRQTLVSGICAKSGTNVQSRRGIRSANVMYLKDLALGEAKNKNFVFSPMSVQLLPATGEDHDGFLSKWIQKVTNALMPSKGYLIWQMAQLNEHWSGQNVKMDIKDSQFYLLEGDSVEVPYVTSATAQLINTFEDLKVLRIPFRFKTLSMYILLPNNGDKLWSLIERVDSDPWFLKRCLCPNTDAVNSNAFFDELKTEEANEVEAPDATATAVESTSVPEPYVDEVDFVKSTFVLDSSGEVVDVLEANYISSCSQNVNDEQRKKIDQQRLMKFITYHGPHAFEICPSIPNAEIIYCMSLC